jgi:hypothetical protein
MIRMAACRRITLPGQIHDDVLSTFAKARPEAAVAVQESAKPLISNVVAEGRFGVHPPPIPTFSYEVLARLSMAVRRHGVGEAEDGSQAEAVA